MTPQDMAALAHFMKEVESLEGNALLDKWIAQRDGADRSELEMQKELYLEVALAAQFGMKKWRRAVEARRKAIRNADRT